MDFPAQISKMSAADQRKAKEILSVLYTKNEFGYVHQNPNAKLSEDQINWLKSKFKIKTEHFYGEEDLQGNPLPTRVHNMCINCQARQVLKYADARDSEGKPVKSWQIDCDFVRGHMPHGTQAEAERLATQKNLDVNEVLKYLYASIDPVKWVEIMFGFDDSSIGLGDGKERYIRSYQKEQLRCTSKRYVIREGRRTGKTFAICMRLLYILFTKEIQEGFDPITGDPIFRGPNIMIITPYQAQLTLIFDELEKLVKRNKHLSRQIATGTGGSLYVRTPNFTMALKDTVVTREGGGETVKSGGVIQGFISGVGTKQDGSGGGTMRGQSTDYLYLDEMDMIPDDILDKVITPIRATSPNVQIIATSTPIGARSKFYEWCLRRPDWKEDYYPTTVVPHWDRIRDEILAETTNESFEAEYMAHFIEGSFGVFKPSFIEKAWADYEYSQLHPETGGKQASEEWWMREAGVTSPKQLSIFMGIDWNKNAGTEFVVVAYSFKDHWWWVVEAVNVSQSEWTSETFKRELARLNHKWQPDFIYADEGWGHTIIEDMQLWAMQLRAKPQRSEFEESIMRLADRLKPYNFSSNVELTDPTDGSVIKKDAKTFLVENAVRVFETQRISYPFSDQVLTKQLQNYTIIKFHASTGKPVYGMAQPKVGDHRLDALMLALAAHYIEHGKFSGNNIKYASSSLHKRDELIRKPSGADSTVASAIEAARKAVLMGDNYYTINKIMYGETEELDALVRQIKAAEEEVSARHTSYHPPRLSRAQEFKPDENNVLEVIRARARPDQSGREHDTWALKQQEVYKKRQQSFSSFSRTQSLQGGKRKMF